MKIRPANPDDLKKLIELEMIIIDSMETKLYQKLGAEKSKDLLYEASELDPVGRYNYKRAIVAQEKDEIVGIVYGFPSEDEKIVNIKLDQITQEKYNTNDQFFPDQESIGDEWYLDSLVVDPKFQGKGIGSLLLKSLPKIVKSTGKTLIGLNVDDFNPRAKKLYLKSGFHEVNRIKIGSHNYSHMQYQIK